jgi:hypothetical protein
VAGIALLTLIINATTTGYVTKKLGLVNYSDLKKNILVSLSYQIDRNMDKNIEVLKTKRHFNNVEWSSIKE